MTTEIMDHPLRLTVGGHEMGEGKACVMELVSWLHDPAKFTDYPDCTEDVLSAMLQGLNDNICGATRVDGGELCAECSARILPLGLKAMGTAGSPDPGGVNRLKLYDWMNSRANETGLEDLPLGRTAAFFTGTLTRRNPDIAVQFVSDAIDFWWTLIDGEPEPVAPETVAAAFEAVTA